MLQRRLIVFEFEDKHGCMIYKALFSLILFAYSTRLHINMSSYSSRMALFVWLLVFTIMIKWVGN